MTESFFTRWSKRKQAQAQGLPAQEAATPHRQPKDLDALRPRPAHGPDREESAPQDSVGVDEPGRGSTPPATIQAPTLPTMDDVKALTPQSDFQPFMRSGVASDVRNAAVKKLFADPHFNVMDGLDIYIGDYNTPDPLPKGMLQNMVGAQLLNLFPSPQETTDPAGSPSQTWTGTRENPDQSPGAAEVVPVVAQSPPSTMMSALQAQQPACPPPEHDHPDLQLQPNHAPASPNPGASTG